MKKLIYTMALPLVLVACGSNEEKVEKEEKTDSTAVSEAYTAGEAITADGALTPSIMLDSLTGKDSMQVKITAKINAVCQVKGCWMTLDMGNGEEMRVRFKDYAFFVPKDAGGKEATVEGWVKVDTISVADLKHYAEDDGKSKAEIDAITAPKAEMSFMANGVVIK